MFLRKRAGNRAEQLITDGSEQMKQEWGVLMQGPKRRRDMTRHSLAEPGVDAPPSQRI